MPIKSLNWIEMQTLGRDSCFTIQLGFELNNALLLISICRKACDGGLSCAVLQGVFNRWCWHSASLCPVCHLDRLRNLMMRSQRDRLFAIPIIAPLCYRFSSVTGILGWIIRITLLLLKNTRSRGESSSSSAEYDDQIDAGQTCFLLKLRLVAGTRKRQPLENDWQPIAVNIITSRLWKCICIYPWCIMHLYWVVLMQQWACTSWGFWYNR